MKNRRLLKSAQVPAKTRSSVEDSAENKSGSQPGIYLVSTVSFVRGSNNGRDCTLGPPQRLELCRRAPSTISSGTQATMLARITLGHAPFESSVASALLSQFHLRCHN